MAEDLDERILNRLVSVGRIAQILIRDPKRPSLVKRDELSEPIACRGNLATADQVANLDRDPRVL